MSARAIIAGGRDYQISIREWSWYVETIKLYGVTSLVIGCCPTGVDAYFWRMACRWNLPRIQFHAAWCQFGNPAGPRRNAAMARYAATGPAICLAFPGGRGTASMCREATKQGIRVIRYREEPSHV